MTDEMRQLYERVPYPASPGAGITLSRSWLDGAVHPYGPVLRPGARVLMTGCGAGAEVRAMGDAGLDVVGVDYSASAVAAANDPRVLQGDLTDPALAARLGTFDLVVCNAVADYVPDAGALMRTLVACVGPAGVLYLGTNTPRHPRERVLRAFDALGDRAAAVAVAAAVMRQPELAASPDVLLDIDVFPPSAHHWPLSRWAELAARAGLALRSTMATASRMAEVPEDVLPALYRLDRASLALLVADLVDDGGSGALFARVAPEEPPWAELAALADWIPTRDAALDGLPDLSSEPRAQKALTVRLPGWSDVVVPVTAGVLELLRRADGQQPMGALWGGLGDAAPLVAGLFRCAHVGLVRVRSPLSRGPGPRPR